MLARDRIGKKPVYYGWADKEFIFGPELKPLWRHPGFDTGIDPAAFTDFLRLGYVLGPRSIFGGMRQLPDGHILEIGQKAAARRDPLVLVDRQKWASAPSPGVAAGYAARLGGVPHEPGSTGPPRPVERGCLPAEMGGFLGARPRQGPNDLEPADVPGLA